MEFEPNEIALWLTRITVGGAFTVGLVALLSVLWPIVRDEWRKGRDRVAKAVFCAAALAGVLYGGAKNASVTYPKTDAAAAYLIDRGSYVTNDYVHIDFERRIVPDDAALVIERRPVASTNDLEWAECLRSTFAAFSVPTNLPCANATNWNWIVYADWTPPPSVHTNGILEVKWGTSRADAAHRARGLAVGIPAQTGIVLGRDRLAVPEARVYTARDYVQDGLVCLWDGIENAGWGVHDSAATNWVDLVGGIVAKFSDSVDFQWTETAWRKASIDGYAYVEAGFSFGDEHTQEVVIRGFESQSYARVIGDNGGLNGNEANTTFGRAFFYGNDFVLFRSKPVSTRQHLALVRREDTLEGYNDGRFVTSSRRGTMTNHKVIPLTFGNRQSGDRGLSADYHCIRLYSRALTDDEIAHNYRVDCARFGLGASAANAAALTAESAAPFASAALDALTGAAPALGEAVQEEDPK